MKPTLFSNANTRPCLRYNMRWLEELSTSEMTRTVAPTYQGTLA
jgi:hypothetical protein